MTRSLFEDLFGGKNRGQVDIRITRPDGTVYNAQFHGRMGVLSCVQYLMQLFPRDFADASVTMRNLMQMLAMVVPPPQPEPASTGEPAAGDDATIRLDPDARGVS